MFFFLSKFLAFALQPIVWVLGAMLLAVLSRKPRRRRWWLVLALVLGWFFSNEYLFERVARAWEPRPTQQAGLRYHYGILLGGFAYRNAEHGQVNFSRASDRVWQTLRLYRQGTIQSIVVSGGAASMFRQHQPSEAELVRSYLLWAGVPDSAIRIETQSKNTYENALYTARLLGSGRDTLQCLLITSAFHQPRALACFRKQGFRPHTALADSYVGQPGTLGSKLLVPKEETMEQWKLFLREWLGLLVYRMQGYA